MSTPEPPSGVIANPFVITPGTAQQGLKRVRAFSAGQLVVDSASPLLVWAHTSYPEYFFDPSDVEVELRPVGHGPRSKVLGVSEVFDVLVGERVIRGAARRHPDAPVAGTREAVAFTWSAFDTWLEEDEVVHTHPRSPYVRVDALASSRHVVVRFRDVTVADSRRPVVLHETGLVPRYYLPRVDVRMDLLTPAAATSQCPYKRTAVYWSLLIDDGGISDLAWSYPTPLPEAIKVAGLIAFWPEKSAELEVTVDGRRIGMP